MAEEIELENNGVITTMDIYGYAGVGGSLGRAYKIIDTNLNTEWYCIRFHGDILTDGRWVPAPDPPALLWETDTFTNDVQWSLNYTWDSVDVDGERLGEVKIELHFDVGGNMVKHKNHTTGEEWNAVYAKTALGIWVMIRYEVNGGVSWEKSYDKHGTVLSYKQLDGEFWWIKTFDDYGNTTSNHQRYGWAVDELTYTDFVETTEYDSNQLVTYHRKQYSRLDGVSHTKNYERWFVYDENGSIIMNTSVSPKAISNLTVMNCNNTCT